MIADRFTFAIALGLLCLVSLGCRSRWAMRDPDYAAKYPVHRDEPKQIIKQAIDARHLTGKRGRFIGGGSSANGKNDYLEIGDFYLDRPMTEFQGSVRAAYNEDAPGVYFGGGLKRRWQLPARGTPFVGVGANAHLSGGSIACLVWEAWTDDDDDDYHHDDEETCIDNLRGLAEITPEVGFHFWPHASARWTASASYHFTSLGREHDYVSINLARGNLILPKQIKPGEPGYDGWLKADPPEVDKPAKWWWEEENPWESELARLPPVMGESP